MFWACARTEVQRETVAERHLKLAGFSTYLPKIKVERHAARADGRAPPEDATAPLFPSYIFLTIAARWYAATTSIGVAALLMHDGHPARVPDDVIAELRGRERDGLVVLPKRPALTPGDRVRIMAGPFQNHLAIFASLKPHERVAVLLSLFGAPRTVELARRDIRRLGKR